MMLPTNRKMPKPVLYMSFLSLVYSEKMCSIEIQLPPFPSLDGRRRFLMTTYEEFMILLTLALLVIEILNYNNHKK